MTMLRFDPKPNCNKEDSKAAEHKATQSKAKHEEGEPGVCTRCPSSPNPNVFGRVHTMNLARSRQSTSLACLCQAVTRNGGEVVLLASPRLPEPQRQLLTDTNTQTYTQTHARAQAEAEKGRLTNSQECDNEQNEGHKERNLHLGKVERKHLQWFRQNQLRST